MSSLNWTRYLSVSDEFGYFCNGTWEGDNDIAGIGVLFGFIIFAYITLLVSIFAAGFETVEWWKDSNNEGRWRSLAGISTHTARPIESTHKLHLICLHLQGRLCDVQIVTGAGIVVAALAQWETITFYHEQIAINCWWLTVNSLFAARGASPVATQDEARCQNGTNGHQPRRSGSQLQRSYMMIQEEEQHMARWEFRQDWIRNIGIFASLTLSATLQAMILVKEYRYWDENIYGNEELSGRCYLTHARDASDWLWCVGTALFAIAMLLEIVSPDTDEAVYNAMSKVYRGIIEKLCGEMTGSWYSVWHAQDWWSRVLNTTAVAALGMATLVAWAIRQFFAVWAYGDGFYPVEIMFEAGYAIYTTWYMLDLRSADQELITSSENTWGFGQVLPVALLATLLINYVDAHTEVIKGRRHTRRVVS
ncbi:hypothetical protein PG984_008263 [Apiospora sp. TS-2023a]